MKIYPQGSYVLIELLPREAETTKSGIVIPEQSIRWQQPIGIVRSVGLNVPDQVVAGMRVIITNGGFKHSHQGKDYVLLQASEILASIAE